MTTKVRVALSIFFLAVLLYLIVSVSALRECREELNDTKAMLQGCSVLMHTSK